MKQLGFVLLLGTALFAQWDNAYGYGGSMVMPNSKVDYNREFKKSMDEKNLYDESMKNHISPKMVEEEDRMMKPTSREMNNHKKNTQDFFYSSNKRDYYRNDTQQYRKFPTTD